MVVGGGRVGRPVVAGDRGSGCHPPGLAPWTGGAKRMTHSRRPVLKFENF